MAQTSSPTETKKDLKLILTFKESQKPVLTPNSSNLITPNISSESAQSLVWQPQVSLWKRGLQNIPRRESWTQTSGTWCTALPPWLLIGQIRVMEKEILKRASFVRELKPSRVTQREEEKQGDSRRIFVLGEPHPCVAHLGVIKKSGGRDWGAGGGWGPEFSHAPELL